MRRRGRSGGGRLTSLGRKRSASFGSCVIAATGRAWHPRGLTRAVWVRTGGECDIGASDPPLPAAPIIEGMSSGVTIGEPFGYSSPMETVIEQWPLVLILCYGIFVQSAAGFAAGLLIVPSLLWFGYLIPESQTSLLVATIPQNLWGVWAFRRSV